MNIQNITVKSLERIIANHGVGENGVDYEAIFGKEELEMALLQKKQRQSEKNFKKELDRYNQCGEIVEVILCQ